MSDQFERLGEERRRMPRWAKVALAAAAVLVVVMAVMLMIGGGKHGGGPLNHSAPAGSASGGEHVGRPSNEAIASFVACLRENGATIDESELVAGHASPKLLDRISDPDPALEQAMADCADLNPMM